MRLAGVNDPVLTIWDRLVEQLNPFAPEPFRIPLFFFSVFFLVAEGTQNSYTLLITPSMQAAQIQGGTLVDLDLDPCS